ncbi:MAG: glycosyltransferase [Gemmatimonadota bacterium]
MSGRKIRVLHAVQSLNYGGMERLIADLIRLSNRDRFELHLLALQYLGRFSEGLERIATLHVAPPMDRWSLLRPTQLTHLIRQIAPDVVHTHSGVWLKAGRAARLAGVPLTIHTEHGRRSPDPWSDRLIDRVAARNSDRVVAVSDLLAFQLISRLGLPKTKVTVVINGVDTELHRPGHGEPSLRRELGVASEIPILGSVGRLESIKGYDIALRALAMLPDPRPVLVIGGDGSERSRLHDMAVELGIRDRVHLLGWRDDIPSIHAASTLFTMSSRSEGTSVSLLEAMSAGLAPVVTDVGGNAAVLGTELKHRLVPAEDPAALAEAWRVALAQPEWLAQDAKAARLRVQNHFSLERMVRSYESLYECGSPPSVQGHSAGAAA